MTAPYTRPSRETADKEPCTESIRHGHGRVGFPTLLEGKLAGQTPSENSLLGGGKKFKIDNECT